MPVLPLHIFIETTIEPLSAVVSAPSSPTINNMSSWPCACPPDGFVTTMHAEGQLQALQGDVAAKEARLQALPDSDPAGSP